MRQWLSKIQTVDIFGMVLTAVLIVAGVVAFTSPARMPEPPLNMLEDSMQAVVHIRAYKEGTYFGYTYSKYQISWQGSGAFIRDDGVIMTAGHVVDGATRFVVTLNDGREVEATQYLAADNMDVGFLKVDVTDVPYLEFASETVRLGDTCFIFGNPFGWMNRWTVSQGIISNTDRDCEGFFGAAMMIQSDAAAYPGNSGGPCLNGEGQIVGVLVGGISGAGNISYMTPTWIAEAWANMFFCWLETRI